MLAAAGDDKKLARLEETKTKMDVTQKKVAGKWRPDFSSHPLPNPNHNATPNPSNNPNLNRNLNPNPDSACQHWCPSNEFLRCHAPISSTYLFHLSLPCFPTSSFTVTQPLPHAYLEITLKKKKKIRKKIKRGTELSKAELTLPNPLL